MEKVKIMVACHKPGPVYHDEVYTPIHVGRAISRFKDEMADMIGDDTGDNISEKNLQYCELTAQYWAWKNLHDVDYIGFCHYRRYFDISITNENIADYLTNHDVIMLEDACSHAIINNVIKYITLDDIHIFLMVLKKLYPEFEEATLDYLYGNKLHTNCMFVCKKKLFDEYAEWLFTILFECEKYLKPSPYTRGKRAFAYMGEYFMPLFFHYRMCRIKKVGKVDFVGVQSKKSINYRIMTIFKNIHMRLAMQLLHKPKSFEEFYYPEVLVGFKSDGIEINF